MKFLKQQYCNFNFSKNVWAYLICPALICRDTQYNSSLEFCKLVLLYLASSKSIKKASLFNKRYFKSGLKAKPLYLRLNAGSNGRYLNRFIFLMRRGGRMCGSKSPGRNGWYIILKFYDITERIGRIILHKNNFVCVSVSVYEILPRAPVFWI